MSRKIDQCNADMAQGALAAIRKLLDDYGIPRGTFADEQVQNLVGLYNRRGWALRWIWEKNDEDEMPDWVMKVMPAKNIPEVAAMRPKASDSGRSEETPK